MADVRAWLAVTDALSKLSLRHGTKEVVEVVESWAAYIHRCEAIIERYRAPDTPEELTG